MPVAQHVLHALEFSDELLALSRRLGKLSGIARSLAQDPILMQQRFGNRRVDASNPFQPSSWHHQRIQARFRTKVLAGAFQSLANLSNLVFLNRLPQLFFLPAAEFD